MPTVLVAPVKIALAIGLLGAAALPAESERYRQQLLADEALKATELRVQYAARSFGPLWVATEPVPVVGFIGDNYQRLHLKLLTVRPDPQQPGRYLVTGKSKVRTTIMAFTGTFRVLHVRESQELPRLLDDAPSPAVKAGLVLAEYELREPAGQPGAGVFRGVLHSRWYQDQAGRLRYDDLTSYGDGFANNQFVGTWQSYKTGAVKRCNWGDYRIANSGDLDIGAGEFSPAEKYLANGWAVYQRACFNNDKAARQQELAAWWK